MTDEQFLTWLKSPSAIRCVLMEVGVSVGGVETTRYISNKTYVTGATDTPANTNYLPILSGGVKFTESIDIEGDTSLSSGDIEMSNYSGERDSWLDDVWANREVQIYIGDVRWARSEFRLIFDGITASNIKSRNRNTLNLTLSDKLQRLNTPITEQKLGGTSQNADRLIPLTFGECHNVEPLLVDAATHEYQVHNGPIENIIEVRDNGVPVSFTPFLSTGKFRLNQMPAGQVTCSVQGDKPSAYTNNAAEIIKRIVTAYGNDLDRLTLSELDTTSFTAFATANTQPVGLFVSDRANVLELCNQLARSVGGRMAMSKDGKLYLVKLALPQTSTGTVVTESDITAKTLTVVDTLSVKAGIKIGYCKNYTVQTNLQTGIPEAHKDLFAQEWLTSTATDETVATAFKLHVEPPMQETLLLTKADADAEALRLLNMFKVQRRVFQYNGQPHLLLEQLGNPQTLKHWRFGLESGKTGQIVSITTDWLNPHVDIQVLI